MPRHTKTTTVFSLRIPHSDLENVANKARNANISTSRYILNLIENDAQDHSRYLAQASARHSFMSFMLTAFLCDYLKVPASTKEDFLSRISQISHLAYGALPPVPASLKAEFTGEETEFINEVFEVYDRHVELQKNALKGI